MGDFCYPEWLCHGVPNYPAPHYQSYSYTPQTVAASSFQRGAQRVVKSKGDRTSEKHTDPGFLQQVFPGAETLRQVEGHSRSVPAESPHKESKIQDGDGGVHQVTSSGPKVGDFTGPKTCLLPCKSSKVTQEVPEVHGEGHDIPVPGDPHGDEVISLGFHEGDKTGDGVCAPAGNQIASVSGRLVNLAPPEDASAESHSGDCEDNGVSGVLGKSCEIRIDTGTEVELFRDGPEFTRSNGGRDSEQVGQTSTASAESPVSRSNSRTLGIPHIYLQVDVEPHGSRGGPSQATPVVPQRSLASEVHATEGAHQADRSDSAIPALVGSQAECLDSSSVSSAKSTSDSIHRRVNRGLGSSVTARFAHSGVVGTVVKRREISPHQCARTKGGGIIPKKRPRVVSGKDGHGGDRQHQCSSLHKQKRRSKVKRFMLPGLGLTGVGKEPGHEPKSKAHSGEAQRCGGHALETGSDATDRVVLAPENIPNSVSTVLDAEHRLVCDQPQSQATGVCLSDARSTGARSGCSESGLDGAKRVCLSADSASEPDCTEDTGGPVRDSDDCTILASATVVSGANGTVSGRTATVTSSTVASVTTQDLCLPRESRSSQPTRMAFIVKKLEEKFPTDVAKVMADPHRASSAELYDSRWNKYVEWCVVKMLWKHTDVPSKSTERQVSEFLKTLGDKGYKHSTLKGYLTAISKVVLLYTDVNLATSKSLSDLITGLCKNHTVSADRVPEWDLSLVLAALKKPPFEPFATCDLKFATYKAAFLLTLAAGGRRSEMNALTTKRLTHGPAWEWVVIYPSPDFMRKNQKVSDGPRGVNPLKITALPKEEGGDMLLCPVRAIMLYQDRVAPHRGDRTNLFLPLKPGRDVPLHVHTFSSWLTSCIKLAYQSSGVAAVKSTGHEVRKVAVSWAHHNQVSVHSLLEMCRWKSPNSFTTYYLKDCHGIVDGMSTIGPTVVAGQLVKPS